MTEKGWRETVIDAARRHDNGDSELLDLLVRVLREQDRAKQVLRDKGHGWTGLSLLKTVQVLPQP